MLAMIGGGNTQLIASSQLVEDYSATAAFASYAIINGNVSIASGFSGGGVVESVVSPSPAYTLFEAKAETVSGDVPAGSAMSTYFDLNSVNPQWYLLRETAGSDTGVFDVTIREKANTANNITVQVTLYVEAGFY